MQAGDFSMYSDIYANNKIDLSIYPSIVNPAWTANNGQEPSKLFDSNADSKWYASVYWNHNNTSTEYNEIINKNWMRFDTGSQNAIAPVLYSWNTAEDVVNRDPVSWKVYGSNDDINWVELSSISNFPTTNERKTRVGIFQLSLVPPTNVVATTRYQSARVSWTPATSGANSYIVTSNPGNMTQTTTSNSLIFNGLTNGTSYTFTVQTINYVGTSIASTVSNAITPIETVADSPTNIKAQFNGNNTIVIWDAPAYTGGVDITDYSVSVNPGNISVPSTSGLTKASITGLPLNTTLANSYTISVSAINSIGSSQATVLTNVLNDTPIATSFKAGYNTQDNNYKLEWPLPNETPDLYELTVNGTSEFLNGKNSKLTYLGITDKVVKVESNSFHTLFLMQNGEVRAMGENGSSGKCGQATSIQSVATPTAMLGIDWTTKKALKIATGSNISAILLNDNTLRVYGWTLEGTYSTVPINYSLAPIGSAKIVDIKCGSGCVFLLLDNGKVMARGQNNSGQLGNGTQYEGNTIFTDISGINYLTNPVKAISTDSNQGRVSLVMQDGTVMFIGNNHDNYFGLTQSQIIVPKKLNGIDGITRKAVKTIFNDSCLIALLDNGKVMSIGRNSSYSLGLNITDYGYTINTFTEISSINGNDIKLKDIHGNGNRTWIGTDINDNKYATGNVYYIGIESNYYKPTLISNFSNFIEFGFLYYGIFAINTSYEVYHGGYEYLNSLGTNTANWTYHTIKKYRDISIITAVDPATSYTFSLSYIKNDLTSNSIGNALVGNLSNSASNITIDASNNNIITNWIGTATSFNVYIDSKLYANTTQNTISIPIELAFSNINIGIEALSIYGSSNIVSLSKNIIKSPSGFYSKYIGPEITNPGNPIKVVATQNANSTVILTENGFVYVIGSNEANKFGLPETSYSTFQIIPIVNVVDIAVNTSSILLVLADGSVWVCGDWQSSGLGNYTNISTFTKIPNVSNVIKVETGLHHAILLRSDGSIYAFGFNGYAQLGQGNTNAWEYIQATLFTFDKKVININAYIYSSGLVMEDGTIRVTGYNNNDSFGLDSTANVTTFTTIPGITNATQLALGQNMSFVLLNDKRVMKFGNGNNNHKNWGTGANTITPYILTDVSNVKHIAVSGATAYFTLEDNSVKVLGENRNGILASTNTTYTTITWQDVSNVSNVYTNTNEDQVFVIYTNGTVRSAGKNNYNSLGYSTTESAPNSTLRLIDNSAFIIPNTSGFNKYEISFDIDPYYPQNLPVQLNVNNNTSLIPRHAINKFNYNGTKQAIKFFANNSDWAGYGRNRFAILMSDGTVKLRSNYTNVPSMYSSVYNQEIYVDIPDLSNVVNILNLSSRIYQPYSFVFITANNRMKVMHPTTGAIVDCTDLSNIPHSLFVWSNVYSTLKVPNIIDCGFEHFVTADGRLFKFFVNNDYNKGEYASLKNIKQVTNNNSVFNGTRVATYALTYDGKVYSTITDVNDYRVLGIGASSVYNVQADNWYLTDLSNVAAVTAPVMHWTGAFSVVLLKNGTLMYNGNGDYNTGLSSTTRFIPIPNISGVVSISSKDDGVVLLFSNGDVAEFNWYNGLQNRRSYNAVSIETLQNITYIIDNNGKIFTNNGWSSTEILPASIPSLPIGPTYTLKARGFLNNSIVGPYINSSLPPLTLSEDIPSSILQQSSVKIRLNNGIVYVPVVSNISTATPNTTVVVSDTSLTSTPIIAYYTAPTSDAEIGSAVSTTVSNGLSKIVLKQTVAGQEVKSLVTTQSASVSTPLTVTNSSGTTAAITTNSAGSGNTVAASITNMDVSSSYVNMFIKVVNSSGSVVASGFTVPIEINIPAATARDTVVL